MQPENSDFGVTGEFLAETLVAVGTGNVDGSYRLIWLKDGCTVSLKMVKKKWHTGVASMLYCSCWGSAHFAINVYLHCLSPLSFRMFLCDFCSSRTANNADCFFTSKTNLMACRHFVCELSWRSFHHQVSLQDFCFFFFICTSLTWSCMITVVFFFISDHQKNLQSFLSCCWLCSLLRSLLSS